MQLAYRCIILKIARTINLHSLFYTQKIVFSAQKVKHFVNFAELWAGFSGRLAKNLYFLWRCCGEEPLSHCFAMPAPLSGEPLAGRVTPAERLKFDLAQKRVPCCLGRQHLYECPWLERCFDAVALGSGALPFTVSRNSIHLAGPKPVRQWLPYLGELSPKVTERFAV